MRLGVQKLRLGATRSRRPGRLSILNFRTRPPRRVRRLTTRSEVQTDALLSVVARDLEELQRVLVALSAKAGATRVVTLLRLREMKPPSPLPI